jgi:hypothetical protein
MNKMDERGHVAPDVLTIQTVLFQKGCFEFHTTAVEVCSSIHGEGDSMHRSQGFNPFSSEQPVLLAVRVTTLLSIWAVFLFTLCLPLQEIFFWKHLGG